MRGMGRVGARGMGRDGEGRGKRDGEGRREGWEGMLTTHTCVGLAVSHKEWTCVLAALLSILIGAQHRVPGIRSCTANPCSGEIGTCM